MRSSYFHSCQIINSFQNFQIWNRRPVESLEKSKCGGFKIFDAHLMFFIKNIKEILTESKRVFLTQALYKNEVLH